jgi:glycine/sarcosine N-methyltransferase
MKDQTQGAYDSLAASYHLIYPDWRKSMAAQGRTLDAILRANRRTTGPAAILDCSCGIGTQAIGLALAGHQVHATDLSPKSVAQARTNAKQARVRMTFGVADFRTLAAQVEGRFDVVLSCDNSLPHLLTEKEVLRAAKNMRAKLISGGICLAGIRDYDAILAQRPRGAAPVSMKDSKGKRIYVQSWDWHKTKPIYQFRLFLLTQLVTRWKTHSVTAQYRAWTRKELSSLFLKAGFSKVRWLLPQQSKFNQPLAILG